MFKKRNSKILLGVFVALLAFFVISKMAEKKKGNRSFKSILVEFDSTEVDYIEIIPKAKDQTVILENKDGWKLQYNDALVSADEAAIYDIFTNLADLKPKRIAATKKDKWTEFEVTDSLATRVILKSDGDIVADVYIGKFGYKQAPGGQYQRQQSPQFFTHVRMADEEEVYVVEKFLTMTFNKELKAFRNKTVIESENENWTKLTYNYPDSSFYLMKQNDKWMMSGVIADSIEVEAYIKNISKLSNSEFVDEITKDQLGNEIFSVTIEGNNFSPIKVNAYPADSIHGYYVTSSMNPDAIFSGNNKQLAETVFAGPSRFEIVEEKVSIDVSK